MRPIASRLLRTRRRRVRLGVALAFASLLGALQVGGVLPSSQAETAPPLPIPGIPLADVPIPDLPRSADLDSLLQMLPAGIAPESLSRVFVRMQDLGVSVDGPLIRISDVTTLREHCHPSREEL